ncbi:unnamed protein product [Hapterophycus canaliculatus]
MTFVTLEEYLWFLRMVSRGMDSMGRHGMLFLAAAVSDFHVPKDKLREHKIDSSRDAQQSDHAGLTLHLDEVPKCLGMIREEWAPNSFRVSFKLETDHERLLPKARVALEKYGMHVVVGNELHSRYEKVELVFPDGVERQIKKAKGTGHLIEEALVEALAQEHFDYISKGGEGTGCPPAIMEQRWGQQRRRPCSTSETGGGGVGLPSITAHCHECGDDRSCGRGRETPARFLGGFRQRGVFTLSVVVGRGIGSRRGFRESWRTTMTAYTRSRCFFRGRCGGAAGQQSMGTYANNWFRQRGTMYPTPKNERLLGGS